MYVNKVMKLGKWVEDGAQPKRFLHLLPESTTERMLCQTIHMRFVTGIFIYNQLKTRTFGFRVSR